MLVVFVHQIVQSFLLPPLNCVLLVLIGLLLQNRYRLFANFLIFLACVLIYLQATPYVAHKLSILLEQRPITVEEVREAKAIVVLGGGVSYSAEEYNTNVISNNSTLVRLRYAAKLAKENPKLPIITSGGNVDGIVSEASLMKKVLVTEFGVTNKIYIEDKSATTEENAKNTSEILQNKLHVKKIILVTSATHIRRAKALFKQNGIEAFGAPTGYYSLGFYTQPILWFVPTTAAMSQISAILHELIGYVHDVGE